MYIVAVDGAAGVQEVAADSFTITETDNPAVQWVVFWNDNRLVAAFPASRVLMVQQLADDPD